METILRKIYTKDRLPDKKGTYHCKRTNDITEITLFFIPDMIHYVNKFKNVEYWWEEMDIDEMLRETTCNMKELFSMSKLFAKERYEKALQSIPEKYGLTYTFGFTLEEWNVITNALKIASGIE